MWEKAEHVAPSLPIEKQSYKIEKNTLDSTLTSAKKQHKMLLSQCRSILRLFHQNVKTTGSVAQLSQWSQLCAGGAEPEGTRKVPPQQVWGHFTPRCPGDPMSLWVRRTTVSHQIIVGSSMSSQTVGLCVQPRILWLGNATACSAVAFLDAKVRIAGSEPIATAGEMHFWDVMVITGTGNFLYFYCYSFLLLFCSIIPHS